jgi:hypothetical protein
MKSPQYLRNHHLTIIKSIAFVFVVLACGIAAHANTVSLVGNSNGSSATATVTCSFDPGINQFTFTITNTSPFNAVITGIGFDLVPGDFTTNGSSGLDGFTGTNVLGFTFRDDPFGNVPQFNSTVLDFGFTTGNSENFNGGSPLNGIGPRGSRSFSVISPIFAGLPEEDICNSIFVRFQQVGPNGQGSDVGTPTNVPEPASMMLLGSGLAGLAAFFRKKRRTN